MVSKPAANFSAPPNVSTFAMVGFLLFLILLILCWPLALVALLLYPLIWVILLPFRIVGIAVGGVLELIWALFTLPARALRRLA
jgi:hypothetical protein